jgi:hypothetical protein
LTQPGRLEGTSLDAIGTVSLLAETASLASGTGKSTQFAVLVDGSTQPVGPRVVADLLVVGIDEDDFVVLHGRILIDPVRVQDTEIGILASNLFFGHGLQVAFKFELVDTLVPVVSREVTCSNEMG